jgi:ATP-dependent RNA helicase DeaD
MESFEELGLAPELVVALGSEGVEKPTPFQMVAIPVIRRGNNLLGRAGPGAGTLVAYGAALLDRLKPGGGSPQALVLTVGADAARRMAEVLATLAAATGHQVAAAGTPWVLPENADVLFGTPGDLLAWIRADRLDVKGVEALVIDQASALQRTGGLAEIEALLEFLPKDGQRVVLALPVTHEVEDFVVRHARRAIQVPAQGAERTGASGLKRGKIRYRIVEEPREEGALQLISELLEDARHCCLFFGNEDRAADVGDYLTLHGYTAGAPGDEGAPVWLAVRELDASAAVTNPGVTAVSYDAPTGPDALDRRHGGGRGGAILVLPREMPHLRDVARRTGYRVVPFPPPIPATSRREIDALMARLEAAASEIDLAPYLIALEPLFERRGALEIAATAVALLRARATSDSPPTAASTPAARAVRPGQHAAPPTHRAGTGAASPPASMVRLYISLGERDEVGPGDILGAVTGESEIAGSQVGRIDIRDTFSIVEVEEPQAELVIRSLNGITVRGRSVRADYDRGRTKNQEPKSRGKRARRKSGSEGSRPASPGPERGGAGHGGRRPSPRRDGP